MGAGLRGRSVSDYLDSVMRRVAGTGSVDSDDGAEDLGFHARREPDGGLSPGTKANQSARELAAKYSAAKWGRI